MDGGCGAAAQALGLLQRGVVEIEPMTAEVLPLRCVACGLCVEVCPASAIELVKARPHQQSLPQVWEPAGGSEEATMPYRGDPFVQNHYYHVYNRGVGRGLLFFNRGNYEHCLRLVKRYYQKYGVAVIAYCLMPNHYHFLLRQETDEPLSKFINVLFNAYVQAVNRQQDRTGTLFEGRFRHVWVDREEYLVHLCRYIHLNPVEAKLVSRPDDWPYSNYLEWVNQRGGTLKDKAFIRERFPTPEAYRQFVANHQDEVKVREIIKKYVWD